jgi:ABC-type lipoprotein export system ATPase subunit
MTIVMVTHESEIAQFAARVLTFRDGYLTSDLKHKPAEAQTALLADGVREKVA